MKIVAKSICTSLVLSTLAFAGTHQNEKAAQPPESPATLPSSPSNPGTGQSNPALRIAPGTVIPVELTKGIDAKKAKSGNAVEAKVTQDLKAENGEVIVPRDTKVVGHVTEAQPRNKEQKESQVGIAFGRAVIKNGGDISVPMSIQAIIASSGPSNNSTSASAGPAAQAPSPGGMSPGGGGGRMGNGTPPPSTSPTPGEMPTGGGSVNTSHPPITAQTQGVVGISNLKLSTTDATLGSVVSLEKSNVKLDSGTLMLLRVSQ